MERQKIWRTFTETQTCGYFISEILEVTGYDPNRHSVSKQWIECCDGSFIMLSTYHIWSREYALDYLFAVDVDQDLYVISGMPELTAQEYKEYLRNDA